MTCKIAVCDDNELDIRYILPLVESWAVQRGILIQTDTFSSAEAFLFHDATHKSYDILLLDIEMEGMDGIRLAEKIRGDNEVVQIIFITGFPDYMAQGYEVSALHYLMKPVSAEKLAAVLDKAVKNLARPERYVIFTEDGEAFRIAADAVLSVEALAHSCIVTTTAGSFAVKSGISSVEKLLGGAAGGFIRCHRSYIVGVRHIKRISKTEITLDSGGRVPLSRGNYKAVNQAFIRCFRGE